MFAIALDLLKEIDGLGYVAYIVGGYSRDKYRGINTEDIDICTNMKYEEIKKHFKIHTSYPKMGSFTICYKDVFFQMTTFRKEGRYLDYRHPSSIEFVNTLEEDLNRRDFVMNTLCIDKSGAYVDLLGARSDIDKKIIRVVGNTREKLMEDPLRILRAIRFSIDFDFELEENLKEEIKKNKHVLKKVPMKKIEEEIEKISSIEGKERVRSFFEI